MKNKKRLFSTFILAITIVALYAMRQDKNLKNEMISKQSDKKIKNNQKQVNKKVIVKKNLAKIQKKKLYVNAPTTPLVKHWEQKAIKNLSYTTLGKAEIRIEEIGKSTINLNGLKKKVNKAKFFLKHKETGKTSNFFAMVDPNTGRIYQTWGATRYENFIPDEDLKLKIDTY